jgi:hypothetical protein
VCQNDFDLAGKIFPSKCSAGTKRTGSNHLGSYLAPAVRPERQKKSWVLANCMRDWPKTPSWRGCVNSESYSKHPLLIKYTKVTSLLVVLLNVRGNW